MNVHTNSFAAGRKAFALSYLAALPKDYETSGKDYPLLIFLHGAGERGTDISKVKIHGPFKLIEQGADYDAVCIAPQCPDGITWDNIIFELMDLIESVTSTYRIDKTKISCTGLSMGGFGTWMLGITCPDMLYKLAPVCGGGMAWRAPVLKNIPIRAFHGTADTVVLPERSVEMVNAVKKAGGNAELTLYDGVGHNSWVNAYEQTDLIEWLIS